jgi:primosomal protein N''
MTSEDTRDEDAGMDVVKLMQSVVRNPAVRAAVHRGFEVRDQALRAQAALLSAANLPSADEVDQLAARLRSVSQRLESIEDALERVERSLVRIHAAERARADAERKAESVGR